MSTLHAHALGVGPVALSGTIAKLRPVGSGGYRFEGGFWGDRQQLVRDVSLPHAERQLFAAGNIGNLRRLVTDAPGLYRGRVYADSDVYKVAEALCWDLASHPAHSSFRVLAAVSHLLRTVQDDDGYVNSWYQSNPSVRRFSDLQMGHEMYCAAHLILAGIAQWRAVENDDLLQVAIKFANHLVEQFGGGGVVVGLCGHPLIESAMVELYRCTANVKYLDFARTMIDRRGQGLLGEGLFGAAYYQDDVLVRDGLTLRGHCVRALYLAMGATDVYLETGEAALLGALEAQWSNTIANKTYLTGGMGCRRKDEAFGAPFELPPDHAFAETCAAVAAIMWSWRLLLATGNGRYADFIERTLYNVVAAALGADGESFFYVNTLHRRPNASEFGDKATRRQAWFKCACCPPNLLRLIASLGHYIATTNAAGVQLHQYASGTMRCDWNGCAIGLEVATDYPLSGSIAVTVVQPPDALCAFSFRRPSWCTELELRVNGLVRDIDSDVDGYITVTSDWQAGDVISLELAMPPRFTVGDERLDGVRGCVALERGPVVYCLEQVDLPEHSIDQVAVDTTQPVECGYATGLGADALVLGVAGLQFQSSASDWPYGPPQIEQGGPAAPLRLNLVPYYLWSNRSDDAMRVWIPRAHRAAVSR